MVKGQLGLFLIFVGANFGLCQHQVGPPSQPDRPDCSASWQSVDLSFVAQLSQCTDYEEGGGVPCSPNNPTTCTGRNPFCAQTEDKANFKCCSDVIQDSIEMPHLHQDQIKPVCPNGAIPFKMPHVMLCAPEIVNICPTEFTCVEAGNGHLLPPESRSLCCKTTTLYSFAKVFLELGLSPRLIPNPPIHAIDYVTLNVHTSALDHAPEIRTGDHFVLAPYRLLEPAYLKKVSLYHGQNNGSYLHVLLFDPNSQTETLQFYYDRKSLGNKDIDLDVPIPDGGFISKRIINQRTTEYHQANEPPSLNFKQNYRKMWVVMVYKTVDPITRLYVSVSTDFNAQYKNAQEFLKSSTAQRLGAPIGGAYFYVEFCLHHLLMSLYFSLQLIKDGEKRSFLDDLWLSFWVLEWIK
uniref:CUB domain-containing protein n=1 Tax=Rhabditophanes sp. KR3021 TaxID=114890 RepID=A0AC35U240_9BILA